jgi:iron(III) transport system permease protein
VSPALPGRPRRLGSALALLVSGLVALPVLSVAWTALGGVSPNWAHLWATVLPDYLRGTLWLSLWVGLGTAVVGAATAWLVTMCRFPGVAAFRWALALPLALPAYVVAFLYTDLLEYAGPVQGALRDWFAWRTPRDYWFPEVRSLGGAAVVMVLAFYPYVYLLARAAFLGQSHDAWEVSRTLGEPPWRAFRRVALPLAWPSLVVGVALAVMEAAGDYGVVSFFAVPTLTNGLFNVWLVLGDRVAGAQIALLLLLFVMLLVTIERRARARRAYFALSTRARSATPVALRGWRAAAAFLACLLPVLLGFALPVWLLLQLALGHDAGPVDAGFARLVGRSLALAAAGAALAVGVALGLVYAARLGVSPLARAAGRVAAFGYAVPGAVLAIGVLIPFGAFDRAVDGLLRERFGVEAGLLLSGTVFALLAAYLVRFLTLSHGTLESGLQRVKPSLDLAARTLGAGAAATLWRVHLPLLRGALLTAALLVFVDVLKELPATLVLRPFDFETLATSVYTLAADERYGEAARPALVLTLAGLVPVVILSGLIDRVRRRDAAGRPELAEAMA